MSNHYIGYWRVAENQTLQSHPLAKDIISFPWPVANSVDDEDVQRSIIEKLKKKLATGKPVAYRGWSTCRLCKKHNGSKELTIVHNDVTYKIPEGYLHYLEAHKVKAEPILLSIL